MPLFDVNPQPTPNQPVLKTGADRLSGMPEYKPSTSLLTGSNTPQPSQSSMGFSQQTASKPADQSVTSQFLRPSTNLEAGKQLWNLPGFKQVGEALTPTPEQVAMYNIGSKERPIVLDPLGFSMGLEEVGSNVLKKGVTSLVEKKISFQDFGNILKKVFPKEDGAILEKLADEAKVLSENGLKHQDILEHINSSITKSVPKTSLKEMTLFHTSARSGSKQAMWMDVNPEGYSSELAQYQGGIQNKYKVEMGNNLKVKDTMEALKKLWPDRSSRPAIVNDYIRQGGFEQYGDDLGMMKLDVALTKQAKKAGYDTVHFLDRGHGGSEVLLLDPSKAKLTFPSKVGGPPKQK